MTPPCHPTQMDLYSEQSRTGAHLYAMSGPEITEITWRTCTENYIDNNSRIYNNFSDSRSSKKNNNSNNNDSSSSSNRHQLRAIKDEVMGTKSNVNARSGPAITEITSRTSIFLGSNHLILRGGA
jgi:hypothetical protein